MALTREITLPIKGLGCMKLDTNIGSIQIIGCNGVCVDTFYMDALPEERIGLIADMEEFIKHCKSCEK